MVLTGTGVSQPGAEWAAIHPVIMEQPAFFDDLSRRDKVKELSLLARKALKCSAERSHVACAAFTKDEKGAPQPSDGVFWSVSHTEGYVAGVVAPYAVGIDIEQIKDISTGVKDMVASEVEWQRAAQYDLTLFFRYWTAKEAVLKAVCQGLSGLAGCTVTEIIDNDLIRLKYHNDSWLVEQYMLKAKNSLEQPGHIAAVTKGSHHIAWHILGKPALK